MTDLPERPVPAVQLRHSLPDGSWHIDLMIATDADGTRPLKTFRLPAMISELPRDQSTAVIALGDHRAAYLTYEGRLSDSRGEVMRLWAGTARWLLRDEDLLVVELMSNGSGPVVVRIRRRANDQWLLDFAGDVACFRAE